MPSESNASLIPALDASPQTARRLRNRGLADILRMGHCAPSIMQAVLDVSGTDAQWPVKLVAGLPGGIGNTGNECGGITAPLVLLGLRYGQANAVQELPMVVYKGHDLLRRFVRCEGTTDCREILGDARIPLRCIGVVRQAPVLWAESSAADCSAALSPAQQDAFGRLYAHWLQQEFHCAHAVFRHLEHAIPVSEDVLDGTSGFLGGTLFTGRTCSALTAGILALGLARGEIENSHLRVLRMIGLMAVRGDAFADGVNAFNKTMNCGNRLAQWFTAEFGSTQCCAITQRDFSAVEGAQGYIADGGTARCRAIAQSVAQWVLDTIRPTHPAERLAGAYDRTM